MKNKQELLQAINEIPTFEKKLIYVKEGENYEEEKRLTAITEQNDTRIITTISKHYKLVQFEEVFKPIIEHFPETQGHLCYYWGSSVLMLFPEGNEFLTDDGKKIGLIISNSVNKAMAINLNFSILVNSHYVVLPKLSGFRQVHMGNVKQIVADYEKFLSQIKQSWKIIMEKFSRKLTSDDVENILAKVGIGKKFNKQIQKEYEVFEHLTLWDLFMDITKKVSDRKYKKEESRIRKLKNIAEAVFEYSIMEAI